MGTLANGSIDLKSLRVAGEGASKYITIINDNGIFVHQTDSGKNGTTPTASTAYGVHISDNIDIIQSGISIASYGSSTRIGDENSNHMVVTSSATEFYSDDSTLTGFISQDPVDGYMSIASNNGLAIGGGWVLNLFGSDINVQANDELTIAAANGVSFLDPITVRDKDSNGNSIVTFGSITVEGHTNAIGYTNSGTGTKSLSSGNTATKISGDLTLGAGTWILTGAISFPSNATGARNIRWYQGGDDITTSVVTTPAVTGGYVTRLQSTAIIDSDTGASMAIYGWQNSGSTLSVTYYWRLVRIA